MNWAIIIEDLPTGGLVQIWSTGDNEKEAEQNIIKHYPKARRADYVVKAILTEQSYKRLVDGGLIQ